MSDYTLTRLVLYFLRLGTVGFGGPVALVGYMERDLVGRKGWISKEEFIEGVALAQMAPGPLAAQLAIYLGWVRGGVLGASLAGLAFIVPSFFMCIALAFAYIHYGSMGWIQSLFYGVGAAVIGIVVNSSIKLLQKTIGKDWLLIALWATSAVLTAWLELEILWVFLLSGLIVLLIRARPLRPSGSYFFSFLPAAALTGLYNPAQSETLWDITTLFAKAGAFVFGSGLAIVPFLYGGVVEQHHWLSERQFIDAVAVAMITPGPVVITVAFIGYLVAGIAGALVAAGATFMPCYLLTVIPAPYYNRFAKHPYIKAFVQGVTTAAIGAIAGATWVLGKRAIIDVPTLVIAAVALGLLSKTKISEPVIIVAAGAVGLLLKTWV